MPAVSSVEKFEGEIGVSLIFGNTIDAWKNVRAEYNKLQPHVRVTLNESTAEEYRTLLSNELSSSTSNWDIFQGNYAQSRLATVAYDFYPDITQSKNVYAGDGIWRNVLDKNAYITEINSNKSYILNSQFLMTAWFVNADAFIGAGLADPQDASKPAVPATWDELIAACASLKAQGYTNPLGLAGSQESLQSSQFSWLLRVYGDQYYREELQNIIPVKGDYNYNAYIAGFEYDEYDTQPEGDSKFVVNEARLYNAILDSSSANFVGGTSEKYKEFLSNLAMISDYVSPSFLTQGHTDVRAAFVANRADKTSPVILLDYLGFGINFPEYMKSSAAPFDIEFFDYPHMTGEHVSTDFVRDVGGNGGYITMRYHDESMKPGQNKLTKDFIKFFMSPYGQSAFYEGLKDNSVAPEGKSLVRHIQTPEEWRAVYDSDKITFNGLCDMNPFLTSFVYTVDGLTDINNKNAEMLGDLITKRTTGAEAAAVWHQDVFNFYQTNVFPRKGYKLDCYLNPSVSPVIGRQ